MTTCQELLDLLNLLDEHTTIEAKRAKDLGKSLLETICAFSNEPGLGGGDILLGVVREGDDPDARYEVAGVENVDRVQSDIVSKCSSVFNVNVRPSIAVERISGKTVMSIHIPESLPSEKPVYIRNQGLPRGAFRRIGSSDVRCTDDDLRMLYQERQGQAYDESVVPDSSLKDIDSDAVAEYRRIRGESNPGSEVLQLTDEELLRALRCIKYVDGIPRPTLAGLILFGTTLGLRRCFPMTRADYIRVPGKEWVEDPENRFESVDMRGPLMSLARRLQTTILDDLPTAFSLAPDAMRRVDAPALPARAIREALVNALMHRDYRVHGPVQIIRYSNRVEIRNPGYSLKAQERLGETGSETRNPTIAAVLHEAGFAENKGSGIRVIRRMMEGAHLTPPAFESDRDKNEFAVYFLLHHFLGEEDLGWLAKFSAYNLAEQEQRSLIFVREVGAIDNGAYRDINHVDTLTASAHLRRLRDCGLLAMKEKGRAAYYVPTENLLRFLGEECASTLINIPLSPMKDAKNASEDETWPEKSKVSHKKPHKKDAKSAPSNKARTLIYNKDVKNVSVSEDNILTPRKTHKKSPKKDTINNNFVESGSHANTKPMLSYMTSAVPHPDQEARQRLLDEVPEELRGALTILAERSTEPEKLRHAIRVICSLGPHTKNQLALLLDRQPDHLASRYLRPMVKEGVLEHTIPENPNHRRQAYVTARRFRVVREAEDDDK